MKIEEESYRVFAVADGFVDVVVVHGWVRWLRIFRVWSLKQRLEGREER